MAVLILVSVGIAVALIFLMGKPPQGWDKGEALLGGAAVEGDRFENLCVNLLIKLGLEVKRRVRTGAGEVDILGVNPAHVTGGDYIVHCVLLSEESQLEPSRVLSLSDTVKAERALKGIMITTGCFSPEVFKLSDVAPLALIDGKEFCRLLKRHSIAEAIASGTS